MQFGTFTPASDVYAFGIVAWGLFSEEEAFTNKNGFEVIDFVVNQKKMLSLDNFPMIDPSIKELVLSCMKFDPEDRPSADLLCKTLSTAVRKASQVSMGMN